MDRFGDNHLRFENLVNYDKSKTKRQAGQVSYLFENLVNYDKSKTLYRQFINEVEFENLVNYDKSKTQNSSLLKLYSLRTL